MTKPLQIKNMLLGEGMPKICVPLMGKDLESLQREAEAAKAAVPDIVEWRADAFTQLMNPAALSEALDTICCILDQIPLLFTIRTETEGGLVSLSHMEYAKILKAIAGKSGADLIDVEIFWEMEQKKTLICELHEMGAKVVGSSHNFSYTEEEEVLKHKFNEIEAAGADILKLAVMPQRFEDVLRLLKVTRETADASEKPVISMSMGTLGMMSRVCGEVSGSALTFGSAGVVSAPGQVPINVLKEMMQSMHTK